MDNCKLSGVQSGIANAAQLWVLQKLEFLYKGKGQRIAGSETEPQKGFQG